MPTPPAKPAIDGGPPAFPEGPPAWPVRDNRIKAALSEAWHDGSWGKYHGPHCDQLRHRMCQLHGVAEAMLTCSGTLAVELALRGLGVSAGDHVLLAGYDFPGNFRAIEAMGAWPVLCDIEADRFVTSPEILQAAIRDHQHPIAAVIVSHLHGELADMPRIVDVAKANQIPLLEDACQATGAKIDGRRAGSFGDVGVFSFGGSKLLTAGRGGALVSNHASVLQRARVYSERGNDAFPLSELQAAVLLPQLDRLDEQRLIRAGNVRRLAATCRSVGLIPAVIPQDTWDPAYFKFGFRADPTVLAWPRETLVKTFTAEGIAVGAGFRGFAKRSARRCSKVGPLDNCQQAAERTMVLHHPILLEADAMQDKLVAAFVKVTDHASSKG